MENAENPRFSSFVNGVPIIKTCYSCLNSEFTYTYRVESVRTNKFKISRFVCTACFSVYTYSDLIESESD